MDAEDREFMRELLGRHEKASMALIAGFERMLRRFDAETERVREHTQEMREDHREFVEEMRAQRTALFRILDRPGDGPARA